MIKIINPGQNVLVNGQWAIDVDVTDADGVTSEDTLTVTVTDPSGATSNPVAATRSAGGYRITVPIDAPGRWLAAIVGDQGAAAATVYASDVVTGVEMPTVADLDIYLGTHSYSDDDLAEALEAETDAQRGVCRIPAAYPKDLRSALLRRSQFHLAMKRVQLGVIPGDADRDTVRPGTDPEVRRLERPHRRLPTG